MKLFTIASNVYSKYYENRVSLLSKEIKYILEFYKNWKILTKNYAYLMPIFNQDDIFKEMPDRCDRYDEVKANFAEITSDAYRERPVTYAKFCRQACFPFQSEQMIRELELLMFDINRYLVLKRRNFPRLYFMNNEDLMEMVGHG